MAPLLEVQDLWVEFDRPDGTVHAVNGVTFSLEAGESLGIVGESGSGKTVSLLSILGLLTSNGRVVRGEAWMGETGLVQDLLQMSGRDLLQVRGRDVGFIFQDPMTSLNPIMRVGDQIAEAMLVHGLCARAEAAARAVELLRKVGIPRPEQRYHDYPYQFSGGMRQRVMIAIALACNPKLLIADEPTTALDVTVQAQVLELLSQLREEMDMGLIVVTHDFGLACNYCDRIAVMYAGKIVEAASVPQFIGGTAHPYSQGLLDSTLEIGHGKAPITPIPGQSASALVLHRGCAFAPRCPLATQHCHDDAPPLRTLGDGHLVACHYAQKALEEGRVRRAEPALEAAPAAAQAGELPGGNGAAEAPLLRVEHLSKYFAQRRARLRAVHDVSFEIQAGETLGVVGESGCGKSTLARAIVRLYEPDGGIVYFEGDDFTALRGDSLRHKRRDVQMIFQDPLASLNPMMTVRRAIVDPMIIHGVGNQQERAERVDELLELVGLDPAAAGAFPFEFSGGQQQRVGIARALALHPKLLICDEPVSALDVSIQAQILTLLRDLQQRLSLTYIFISHNLAVVEYMSDHIAVMYLGVIMERAPAEGLFRTPAHPYTRALMTSVLRMPRPSEPPARVKPLGGEVPSAVTPPPGCPFHTRCPEAIERCYKEIPELRTIAPEHQVACHLA